jgi:hypothetical protein
MISSNLSYALSVPYNNLSFGQVATAITRELFKRGELPAIFPMFGQQPDLSSQVQDVEFNLKLAACIGNANQRWDRTLPSLRLWHIQSSLESLSKQGNHLLTFHELDQLTPSELNILRQQAKVYVTSTFSRDVFNQFGITAEYLPIGFDSHNFKVLDNRPTIDGVIRFLLPGKAEQRKGTYQVLRTWAKRYGNNAKYRLNCAIHNQFLPNDRAAALLTEALGGQHYWNIQFLPWAPDNATYNVTLQSSQIVISMSGGEGRDLPCYHATAMGAWPVAMRAHAYLDYLNDDNAVLVSPNGKRPAADGVHFAQGTPFNQGNFFSFDDDAFIAGCEEAEKRVLSKGLNTNGLDLQKVGYQQAADILLRDLKG